MHNYRLIRDHKAPMYRYVLPDVRLAFAHTYRYQMLFYIRWYTFLCLVIIIINYVFYVLHLCSLIKNIIINIRVYAYMLRNFWLHRYILLRYIAAWVPLPMRNIGVSLQTIVDSVPYSALISARAYRW